MFPEERGDLPGHGPLQHGRQSAHHGGGAVRGGTWGGQRCGKDNSIEPTGGENSIIFIKRDHFENLNEC